MRYRFVGYALGVIFLLADTTHAVNDYAGTLVYGQGKLDRLTSLNGPSQPIHIGDIIHTGDIICTG